MYMIYIYIEYIVLCMYIIVYLYSMLYYVCVYIVCCIMYVSLYIYIYISLFFHPSFLEVARWRLHARILMTGQSQNSKA